MLNKKVDLISEQHLLQIKSFSCYVNQLIAIQRPILCSIKDMAIIYWKLKIMMLKSTTRSSIQSKGEAIWSQYLNKTQIKVIFWIRLMRLENLLRNWKKMNIIQKLEFKSPFEESSEQCNL